MSVDTKYHNVTAVIRVKVDNAAKAKTLVDALLYDIDTDPDYNHVAVKLEDILNVQPAVHLEEVIQRCNAKSPQESLAAILLLHPVERSALLEDYHFSADSHYGDNLLGALSWINLHREALRGMGV